MRGRPGCYCRHTAATVTCTVMGGTFSSCTAFHAPPRWSVTSVIVMASPGTFWAWDTSQSTLTMATGLADPDGGLPPSSRSSISIEEECGASGAGGDSPDTRAAMHSCETAGTAVTRPLSALTGDAVVICAPELAANCVDKAKLYTDALRQQRKSWGAPFWQEFWFYCCNTHEVVSLCAAHPKHPVTRGQRVVMLIVMSALSLAFS